jgi:hypothetical protein
VNTVRSQRDEARSERDEAKQQIQETATQLVHVCQELQTSQFKVNEWEEHATQNHQLYLGEQQRYQQVLCLYNEEQVKAIELFAKYEEADTQRSQYLALYNKAQQQLKYEKRSKAGIKSWETRRKLENERLNQQISDMVILLRESLQRKEESINYLYLMGDRMDRIQRLMGSAEQESSHDRVGLLEKLMHVWLAVQKILAE